MLPLTRVRWRHRGRRLYSVPVAFVFVALVLSWATPALDRAVDADLRQDEENVIGFVFDPATVAGTLSAIASGMIAFSGLVFTLLLLAAQFGTGQPSARLVPLLAGDLVVRSALGVFTSTFVYSLLISIRLGTRLQAYELWLSSLMGILADAAQHGAVPRDGHQDDQPAAGRPSGPTTCSWPPTRSGTTEPARCRCCGGCAACSPNCCATRAGDHPALLAAAGRAAEVLGVFVLDEDLLRPSGAIRRAFVYDCLRDLDEQLGGRLLVVRGKPVEVLPGVAESVGARSVHVSAGGAGLFGAGDDLAQAGPQSFALRGVQVSQQVRVQRSGRVGRSADQ
ncbi:MAG TPA: DUF2254 family protein [Pseudonocardiaceae bacterium]|nr:DUF2254 family protein [Pseudonocardiaceae bacterium]